MQMERLLHQVEQKIKVYLAIVYDEKADQFVADYVGITTLEL